MKLTLNQPHGLEVIPEIELRLGCPAETTIRIGEHKIPMTEFRRMMALIMCSDDLCEEGDDRLQLLDDMRSLTVVRDERGCRLDSIRSLPHQYAKR